jgi:adenine-specific DNA-methyltransferase
LQALRPSWNLRDPHVRLKGGFELSTEETIRDYRHDATRLNNPDAGMAEYVEADPAATYFPFDPHADPQLIWAGKRDEGQVEVPAVPIHVHERISARALLGAVQREDVQRELFSDPDLPDFEEIAFYEHDVDWANRLILGDALVVMASLLEKERMRGAVQTVYIDPPYGIDYKSNFQPLIGKTSVKDNDRDLTREPEQIKAYRDTWELGVHSYLTYLRDRIVVARELLAPDGSIFVQIGDERIHLVRALLDEIFGPECFCSQISFRKKIPLRTTLVPNIYDHILWYARTAESGKPQPKFRRLFRKREAGEGTVFTWVEEPDGTRRKMTDDERRQPALVPSGSRIFALENLVSAGRTESCVFPFNFDGTTYPPPRSGKSWKTNPAGMEKLIAERRIYVARDTPRYVQFIDDYPVQELPNVWTDTQGASDPIYVVQTAEKVVERCILMTTDPGDLVLDPTCGSGTTAVVAERQGRRWITCDTSRVAVNLARQRHLTASFPYFKLANDRLGPRGGFIWERVPHVTLGSITRGEQSKLEVRYDRPEEAPRILRVSGPFTVEALAQYALAPEEDGQEPAAADGDYVERLLGHLHVEGVPSPDGTVIPFTSFSRLATGGAIHGEGTYVEEDSANEIRVGVSVGPLFGPVTPRQVKDAFADAAGFDRIFFLGFAFDPEAQAFVRKQTRYDAELVHVRPDMVAGHLLKQTPESQIFAPYASPDLDVRREADGLVVEVKGLDIFDPVTGAVRPSSRSEIAAWFLDRDHDGEVFLVTQAFFPYGSEDSWKKLARDAHATLNLDRLGQLSGYASLPFELGDQARIAVKVVDLRGNEAVTVIGASELPD